MAQLHLVVGPVGAGKSTFVRQLCREHAAVRLNLDEWMAELFGPDRPPDGSIEWYVERAERCIEQIWILAKRLIHVGTDVVLEIGLIQKRDREEFYRRVDASGYDLRVYVLDAPRELRADRVAHRNLEAGDTFSMEVPRHVFELASDLWEPPDEDECRQRDVRFIGPEEVPL
ncbi:MAG: ATP-binding protein [Proteobacteria bacterium]|nr:ATP-binding protein [Pseudomonadota bacterium]